MKDIHLALSHGLLQRISNVRLMEQRGKTHQIHLDRVNREEMARCVKEKTSMLKAGEIVDRRFIDGELCDVLIR